MEGLLPALQTSWNPDAGSVFLKGHSLPCPLNPRLVFFIVRKNRANVGHLSA